MEKGKTSPLLFLYLNTFALPIITSRNSDEKLLPGACAFHDY